eukprot:4454530-Karenia_brevis.AAC.1
MRHVAEQEALRLALICLADRSAHHRWSPVSNPMAFFGHSGDTPAFSGRCSRCIEGNAIVPL